MKAKDVLIFLAGAVLWYLFFFYLIFSIQYGVNALVAAFVLLVLSFFGVHCCCYVCGKHCGMCKTGTKKKK